MASNNKGITFGFQSSLKEKKNEHKNIFDDARGNTLSVQGLELIKIGISRMVRRHSKSNEQNFLISRRQWFMVEKILSTACCALGQHSFRLPTKIPPLQEFTSSPNCNGLGWEAWKLLRLKFLGNVDLKAFCSFSGLGGRIYFFPYYISSLHFK